MTRLSELPAEFDAKVADRATVSPRLTPIRDAFGDGLDEMRAIRHDLHENPELGFEELRTSEMVARRLASWGYAVHRGLGGTGVVGTLKVGDGTRRLGLRADMDALPILEKTGLPWASKRIGVMHACGHDGHTAMLLGAARHLARTRAFDGTLNLIFQPAEEEKGGAKKMVADGLFEKFPCDAIFAMHNAPGVPAGRLLFRSGAAMASYDAATVTLTGKGGHGAMPHRATDSIVAAASIVMALQSIVARNVDPLDTAVVTVGAIHGGQFGNVIPESVSMEISIRSLNRQTRTLLARRVREVVDAQAACYGVTATVDYSERYPVLVNTPDETRFAAEVGRELVGDANVVVDPPPVTGSEDFAWMLEKCPGSYLFIGNGDGEATCGVHNPGYDFNDAVLPTGAAYWVLLTERFLR